MTLSLSLQIGNARRGEIEGGPSKTLVFSPSLSDHFSLLAYSIICPKRVKLLNQKEGQIIELFMRSQLLNGVKYVSIEKV